MQRLQTNTFYQESDPRFAKMMSNLVVKATNIIEQFLNNLVYVFGSHGISHQIYNYQPLLIKMLIPEKLLKFINFKYRNSKEKKEVTSKINQFKPKNQSGKYNLSYMPNQNEKKKIRGNTLRVGKRKNLASTATVSPNYLQSSYQNQYQHQYQNQFHDQYDNAVNNIFDTKHKKRPTLLHQQIQQKICQWIISSLNKGIPIRKIDILNFAQEEIRSQGFKASYGWCQCFLKRNPYVRRLLRRQKSFALVPYHQLYKNQNDPRQRPARQADQRIQTPAASQAQVAAPQQQPLSSYQNEQKPVPQKANPLHKYLSDSYKGYVPYLEQNHNAEHVIINEQYEPQYEQIPMENNQRQNQSQESEVKIYDENLIKSQSDVIKVLNRYEVESRRKYREIGQRIQRKKYGYL